MSEETVSPDEVAAIRDRYEVEPRNWLELEPSYSGYGVAEFVTNPGKVAGPTTVRFAEDGTLAEFLMSVEAIDAAHMPSEPDAAFVFVNALPEHGTPGSYNFVPGGNECMSVEVRGDAFTLAPRQRGSVIALGGNATVEFRPYRTVVRYPDAPRPRYWAVPLINLVVDFRLAKPALHGHPLRTRSTAPYEHVDFPRRVYHESFFRAGNALIPFLCEREPAFIEPLPDYSERRARVESGETVVTAVMVGELPDDFDESAEDWFPADLVTLLGLASGRTVAVPYVELRGSAGDLVARMHTRIGDAGTSCGTALIDEAISGTTGALLTSFLVSSMRNEVWFRVMLKHLLRAFSNTGVVEDRLNHLFRAIEGAAAGRGLTASRPLEVEEHLRIEIEEHIDELVHALAEVGRRASVDDRARIDNLANRVRGIKGNSPSFPTQLNSLLADVGLPDAGWLSSFQFKPRRDGDEVAWPQAAGRYRNRIVHSGFIDFDDFDTDNAIAFIRHLMDVLARTVFHLVGFVGMYSPPCGNSGARTFDHPNWAQPERLSASVFGYRE